MADLIQNTADYVRQELEGEGSGHDWWHIYQVWQLSRTIGIAEGADLRIVEPAALLHDIADWKFHDGDLEAGPRKARAWLVFQNADEHLIDEVCDIVRTVSFKGAGVPTPMRSLNGEVVQDADRITALGAIGIARTFAYGGYKRRPIYDPTVKPHLHQSFEEYKKNESHTINHFYEKLLLLKDMMHTATGRRIAEDRHKYMQEFLGRFYLEWDGKA
jgi:uncharacterized protein